MSQNRSSQSRLTPTDRYTHWPDIVGGQLESP